MAARAGFADHAPSWQPPDTAVHDARPEAAGMSEGSPDHRLTRPEIEAMLRAAFALFARWGLDGSESRVLLGQPSARTFQRWKAGQVADIPSDTVWRLGDLMGIHKALRYMFTDPERGYRWVRQPNAMLGGQSALDRMLAGAPADLAHIRTFLDAERGGW